MDSNEKLTARIHLKVTESTFDGLKKIQDQHRLTPQDVLRGLAEAAVEFYEENGYFVFPIKITSVNSVLFGKTESALTSQPEVKKSKGKKSQAIDVPGLDKIENDERSRVVSGLSPRAQAHRFRKATAEAPYHEERGLGGVSGFTALPGRRQRKTPKK